jgi:hypothetical protein
MKFRRVRSELFHAGRRTDRLDEANSRFFFRYFAKAPKNYLDRAVYFRKIFCFSWKCTKLSGASVVPVPYICALIMLLLLMVER